MKVSCRSTSATADRGALNRFHSVTTAPARGYGISTVSCTTCEPEESVTKVRFGLAAAASRLASVGVDLSSWRASPASRVGRASVPSAATVATRAPSSAVP